MCRDSETVERERVDPRRLRGDGGRVMRILLFVLAASLVACGEPVSVDESRTDDSVDAGAAVADPDAGIDPADSGAETPDASIEDNDAGLEDAGVPDAGEMDAGMAPTTALLRPNNPMPCADPAVVSEDGANQVFYVFCTGMSHVW